jgi:carbonic anhydrase/acetyltransferase-like protein (isoleucine patch superfamily)
VLRGDEEALEIGRGANVQDNCVLHADPGFPVVLGDDVTVGHTATVHGSRVANATLIGMGAVLLNGCEIGRGPSSVPAPSSANGSRSRGHWSLGCRGRFAAQ